MQKPVFFHSSLLLCLLISCWAFAQGNPQINLQIEDGGQVQFNTNADLSNGKMQSNQVRARIQKYGGSNNVKFWKLTVRLTDDFYSQDGAYHVDAHHAKLIFNSEYNGSSNGNFINPSNVPVALSKINEVTLIESDVELNTQTHRLFRYDLLIEGGTHLLSIPNGFYRTSYEFRLYGKSNANGNYFLVDNFTTGQNARFQMNYNGNYSSQSLTLENGANLVNMEFNTATDYANGKSVSIPNGLRVRSYNNHQVLVKTSNNVFTSSTTSGTIPVSKLHVNVSLNQPMNNVQLLGPLSLSTIDQVLINRTDNYPQTLFYDLQFFIPPNTLQASDIEGGGTYTTYVFFTIAPN